MINVRQIEKSVLMKLIEIIKYLLHRDKLEEFYQKYRLNQESEALLIYMKESIDLESEITIFRIGGNTR